MKKSKSKKKTKNERSRDNSEDKNKGAKIQIKNENEIKNINKEEIIKETHWNKYYDNNYKEFFYVNVISNESVWELPKNAVIDNDYSKTVELTNKKEEINEEEQNQNESDSEENIKDKYNLMKEKEKEELLKNPARKQVESSKKDDANLAEGNYEYNIWYNRFLSDYYAKEKNEKIKSEFKCNFKSDTGYTLADKNYNKCFNHKFFCLYFARGCCSEGYKCFYFHHRPSLEECELIDNSKDIFGRTRFASPLKDSGGVGLFTKNCRTLYISTIMNKEDNHHSLNSYNIVKKLYENFSPFGDIDDIQYLPTKNAAYIKFIHRCFAEFAKEGMMKQTIYKDQVISISWGYNFENEDITENQLNNEENNKLIMESILENTKFMKSKENDKKEEDIIKNCTELQKIFNDIERNKEES